jgi:hypothetical protein
LSHSASPSRSVTAARSCRVAEGGGKMARSSSSGPWLSSTRVRVADGIRTTVYVICVRHAGDLGRARREQWRVVWQAAFSTGGNFLASHIRQRLDFRPLPRLQGSLVLGVVAAALVAPLVLRVRPSTDGGLLELATDVLAVAVSSIVRAADEERPPAVAAAQLEDDELDHPPRMAENWTSTSRTATVRGYWRVHPPLVHRGLRPLPGPSLFHPVAHTYRNAPHGATSPTIGLMVPWSPGPPVIPVEVVPLKAGGDSSTST